MFLMSALLMIGDEAPAQEAHGDLLFRFRQIIDLDSLNKCLIFGASLDYDPVLVLGLSYVRWRLQLQLVLIHERQAACLSTAIIPMAPIRGGLLRVLILQGVSPSPTSVTLQKARLKRSLHVAP